MCMCGITGWVNWNKDLSNEHVILEKMANSIQHRGPDAEGFLVFASCGLCTPAFNCN